MSTGLLSLYQGEKKVGERRTKTQPGLFSIAGEGLCVGRDSGEHVTSDYPGDHPHTFTGGAILVNIYSMRMAAVFTLTTVTIARRTQIMSRWLTVAGIATALVLLIGVGIAGHTGQDG